MEDIKKQINYKKEWIKKDLKNSMPLLSDPNQKLLFLDQQLKELYSLGLIDKDINILNTIIKYREEQKKQEDLLDEPQKNMVKNMENIIEHLMREL